MRLPRFARNDTKNCKKLGTVPNFTKRRNPKLTRSDKQGRLFLWDYHAAMLLAMTHKLPEKKIKTKFCEVFVFEMRISLC